MFADGLDLRGLFVLTTKNLIESVQLRQVGLGVVIQFRVPTADEIMGVVDHAQ